jgi:hypothetical protein
MKHLRRKKGLKALIFLIVSAAVVALIMLLWNVLLPELFGIKTINYWQTAGLFIFIRLLFGGFGRFSHGVFHHFHGDHERLQWKKEKLRNLFDKTKGMSCHERCEFIRERMSEMDKGKEDEEKN